MDGGLGFLTSVYRDGRVLIGGKSYPAGTFVVPRFSKKNSFVLLHSRRKQKTVST